MKGRGGVSSATFSGLQGQSAEKVTVNYDYHGANGVFGKVAPEIDVYGNILLQEDKKLSTLYVAGILRGDNFPSTESFIKDASGQAVFLGIGFYDAQGGTKETGPFLALFGDKKRSITSFGLIIELDGGGNFVSVIGGPSAKRYSIKDWNERFLKCNPNDKKSC